MAEWREQILDLPCSLFKCFKYFSLVARLGRWEKESIFSESGFHLSRRVPKYLTYGRKLLSLGGLSLCLRSLATELQEHNTAQRYKKIFVLWTVSHSFFCMRIFTRNLKGLPWRELHSTFLFSYERWRNVSGITHYVVQYSHLNSSVNQICPAFLEECWEKRKKKNL